MNSLLCKASSNENGWCESSVEYAGHDSLRPKEVVKQGLSDRNGTIAFGRVRERFGKTAGVPMLTDVFHLHWTSSDNLEDKWLTWVTMMRLLSTTPSGDDARETLTIAGLDSTCRLLNAKCSTCGKTAHLKKVCRQHENSEEKTSSSSSSAEGAAKVEKSQQQVWKTRARESNL